MECRLRSGAIIIEVTSCHAECIHFNLGYSRMPVVALQSNWHELMQFSWKKAVKKLGKEEEEVKPATERFRIE